MNLWSVKNELIEFIKPNISKETTSQFNTSCNTAISAIKKQHSAILETSGDEEALANNVELLTSARNKILDTMKQVAHVYDHADPEYVKNSLAKYDKSLSTPEARNERIESIINECTEYFNTREKYHPMSRSNRQPTPSNEQNTTAICR
jgi:hypothetical protein